MLEGNDSKLPTFPVRLDCAQHQVPKCPWLLPIERITVNTNDVPEIKYVLKLPSKTIK